MKKAKIKAKKSVTTPVSPAPMVLHKTRAAPTESFQPFADSTSKYSFRSRSLARYSFIMTNGLLENLPELELPSHRDKGQDQIVYYVTVRCPGCGSDKAPVRNTKPPAGGNRIRYHKCSECGLNFKSVERISK